MVRQMTIPIKSITITRAEGPRYCNMSPVQFTNFDDARKWLIVQPFPKNGSYDKTDFTIEWEDGETYDGRLDCKHITCRGNDLDIQQHVIEYSKYCAGMTRYPYEGRMAYRTTLLDMEKHYPGFCVSYRNLLINYLLDPAPDTLGEFCERCNILLTDEERQQGSLCTYCQDDDRAEKIRQEKMGTFIRTFQINGETEPDDRDRKIATERFARWDDDPEPRVGDYVIMPDGTYARLAYIWPESIQITNGGSFHIGSDGHVSMSGGLEPGFPKERFHLTDERNPGYFWFFHHGSVCASGGVGAEAFCRVYELR